MELFYLFDKSGSMHGEKINQVNLAMKDIPQVIRDATGSSNANIMLSAATFSSVVDWITPKPQAPDEFINVWKDIQAGGTTSLGSALKSLNDNISKMMYLDCEYNNGLIAL